MIPCVSPEISYALKKKFCPNLGCQDSSYVFF